MQSYFKRSGFFGLAVLLGPAAWAQDSFAGRYQARVARALEHQPHWATPLITINARVEQGFRADFVRQTTADGQTVWNDGGTKGLQIVPFARTELRISPPPFFAHSDPKLQDGFGDFAVRLKYQLFGSNEQHHNAIVSAILAASLPTGKQANGSCCAILTPTLEIGKGVGKLALTSAASGTLPASNTVKLGRSIVWNNAIQYRLTEFVWVENEFNSTFYQGGKFDGKQQTFTTPGVIVSRIPLVRGTPSNPRPLALSLGVGEQIALSHFNTYNHSPIFSGRLRF